MDEIYGLNHQLQNFLSSKFTFTSSEQMRCTNILQFFSIIFEHAGI